jgi:ADP-L-glycero-D-manno-heptose 6-epimerase
MIILTGGAGFIGANVLSELNQHGVRDVIVVDDLTNGAKMQQLRGKRFADYFDFREFLAESKKLKHISHIIHLGAISDTRFDNGKILTAQNFTFSKEMLNLAIEHRCPFAYASSASVYGQRTEDFTEHPGCEDPQTPYAISKWMFDQYVRQAIDLQFDGTKGTRAITSAPVVGLRYFNVYGPGEELKGDMASFPYKCLMALRRREKIYIFEDGPEAPAARDFVYVRDVALATVFFSVWSNQHTPSGIYNIGTGTATTFWRIAELAGATSSDVEVVPIPVAMRGAYQNFTQANLDNLKAAGYKYGFRTAEAGVQAYKTYLEEHPCLKTSF